MAFLPVKSKIAQVIIPVKKRSQGHLADFNLVGMRELLMEK
jgi:hypothetical protein